MLVTDFVAELAISLAKQNERAGALALIDGSIGTQLRCDEASSPSCPLFGKGLTVVCGEARQNELAQECFEEAMTLAGQQSALSFELRAGLELARLWIDQGQIERVHDLIGSIYRRFTEGFETPDLVLKAGISSNKRMFGCGKPDEGRRNRRAGRKLERSRACWSIRRSFASRLVNVNSAVESLSRIHGAHECPGAGILCRLFLALRPPKLSRSSTEHMTEMTR